MDEYTGELDADQLARLKVDPQTITDERIDKLLQELADAPYKHSEPRYGLPFLFPSRDMPAILRAIVRAWLTKESS